MRLQELSSHPGFDRFARMYLEQNDEYRQVVGDITAGDDHPTNQVLLGHQAYLQHRYQAALEHYAACLIEQQGNLFFALMAGFCLRKIKHFALANHLLFFDTAEIAAFSIRLNHEAASLGYPNTLLSWEAIVSLIQTHWNAADEC
jgi:hypothetical protein